MAQAGLLFALGCFVALLAMVDHTVHADEDTPEDYLSPHNAARAAVGVGPLSWSSDVAAYAREYAYRRWPDCALVHSGGPYGENLFEGSYGYTGASAVEDWVSEQQYYDYYANGCAPGQMCGHYTQVVWVASVHLGCASARCANGDVFITCNYDPPGNVIGERPY